MKWSRTLLVLAVALAAAVALLAGAGRAYAPPTPTFTDIAAGLEGVESGSVAWGDYNSAAEIAFSASDYSIGEDGRQATITIDRNGLTAIPTSVQFATASGTATESSNYRAVSKTVSFAAGETQETVAVPIIDDARHEPNKTVLLKLSSPSAGAVLGTPSTATLTIIDNDPLSIAGKIVSCRLSRKSFKRSRAAKVKLTCAFNPKSRLFDYALSIKRGARWAAVTSGRKTGSFATCTLTVKQLFARKPVKRGVYRLRLSAEASSRTLGFAVR